MAHVLVSTARQLHSSVREACTLAHSQQLAQAKHEACVQMLPRFLERLTQNTDSCASVPAGDGTQHDKAHTRDIKKIAAAVAVAGASHVYIVSQFST